MTRAVIWSRAALDDLKAQLAYIAAENPAAARRVANAIMASALALSDILTGRPGRVINTYEKPVTRLAYMIAYAITSSPTGDSIAILRVIHTARWLARGAVAEGLSVEVFLPSSPHSRPFGNLRTRPMHIRFGAPPPTSQNPAAGWLSRSHNQPKLRTGHLL